MTSDEYLRSVLARYAVQTGTTSPGARAAASLMPLIQAWGRNALDGVFFSGSYAKGTAVKGRTDVDLFISLKSSLNDTLQQIFESLDTALRRAGYSTRQQNVSIGTVVGGVAVDLVPGKKHPGNTNDHSLYLSKRRSWTKTNVAKHIALVADSGRLEEIRILKIWRQIHGLEFPSFYLELTVLESLAGRAFGDLGRNVQHVLEYMASSFEAARVVDPANTNNIISDDLTSTQRQAIAGKAGEAARATDWSRVVA